MTTHSSHAAVHAPKPLVFEATPGPDSEHLPKNGPKAAKIYDRYTHVLSLQRQVSSLQRLAVFRQGQVAKAHQAVAQARKDWLKACARVGRLPEQERATAVSRMETAHQRYERKKDFRDKLTTPAAAMWSHHVATADAHAALKKVRGQLTLNPTSVTLQHRFLSAQTRYLETQRAKLMTQLRMGHQGCDQEYSPLAS